ncbi:MAG: hypothetical protein U5R49_20760 [Deltaproteobacteria bacterium]|nr:hypothetical protein [Deltaproteobacteria bacterium]
MPDNLRNAAEAVISSHKSPIRFGYQAKSPQMYCIQSLESVLSRMVLHKSSGLFKNSTTQRLNIPGFYLLFEGIYCRVQSVFIQFFGPEPSENSTQKFQAGEFQNPNVIVRVQDEF